MLEKDESVSWMPWVGLTIFIIVGLILAQFRKNKVSANEWGYSDFSACIAIPVRLF
ncbi:MAG: LPXTG-motif cell wall-anchored protein [Lentisphaeria bacterium]|jgi:LPXTG-motif cell wall-anchored protein